MGGQPRHKQFSWQQVVMAFRSWRTGPSQPRGSLTTETNYPSRSVGANGPLLDESFLRRLDKLLFLARQPASGGVGGDYRSRAKAASVDFADYRAYVVGDDFRRIDWNLYARLGEPYIKLTEAREHLPVYLLLDCSRSMDWGDPNKFDFARAIAAALGYVALSHNDPVYLVRLGHSDSLDIRLQGRGQVARLLSLLQEAQPSARLHMGQHVHRLAQQVGSRSLRRGQALLVSDLWWPQGVKPALNSLLTAAMDVVLIHVLSPQELEPGPGGDVELSDLETGEVVEVGLTMEAVHSYRRRLEAWLEEVRGFCFKYGVRYVFTHSSESLESAVLTSMRRGGVLA